MHCSANITVRIGSTFYNVDADFRVNPGEPMVRYYADGSGYPGSPTEIDCIDSVSFVECERPIDGNVDNDNPQNWEYADRKDFAGSPERIAWIERTVYDVLSDGSYNDELLDSVDYDDQEDDDYYDED